MMSKSRKKESSSWNNKRKKNSKKRRRWTAKEVRKKLVLLQMTMMVQCWSNRSLGVAMHGIVLLSSSHLIQNLLEGLQLQQGKRRKQEEKVTAAQEKMMHNSPPPLLLLSSASSSSSSSSSVLSSADIASLLNNVKLLHLQVCVSACVSLLKGYMSVCMPIFHFFLSLSSASQVETITVLPSLVSEIQAVDFGQIALGRVDVKHITIRFFFFFVLFLWFYLLGGKWGSED